MQSPDQITSQLQPPELLEPRSYIDVNLYAVEAISQRCVNQGNIASEIKTELELVKSPGCSTFGESLQFEDDAQKNAATALGHQIVTFDGSVDLLTVIAHQHLSRSAGQFRRSPKSREFFRTARDLANSVTLVDEEYPNVDTFDIFTYPKPLASSDTETTLLPDDLAAYIGKTYIEAVKFFSQPIVVDFLEAVKDGRPPLKDKIIAHPWAVEEPWIQALVTVGSIVQNEDPTRYGHVRDDLTDLRNRIQAAVGTVKGTDLTLHKPAKNDELRDLMHQPLTKTVEKSIKPDFHELYEKSLDHIRESETETSQHLEVAVRQYSLSYVELLKEKNRILEVIYTNPVENQAQLLDYLQIEDYLAQMMEEAVSARPRVNSLPNDSEIARLVGVYPDYALKTYIENEVRDASARSKEEWLSEQLTSLYLLRNQYRTTRTVFDQSVDPTKQTVRGLANGFDTTLMGRQLVEPVAKNFAREFLSTMYRLSEQINSEGAVAAFDSLLINLEREEQLTTVLESFGVDLSTYRHETTLHDILSWYVDNEIKLGGMYLKLLPPYVSEVLQSFDRYWSNLTEQPTESGRRITKETAEEIMNKLTQLDFRMFPPDISFDSLQSELIEALGKNSKHIQKIDWQKLDNLLILHEYYSELPNAKVNLYRALPGSLKQSFPYYVLEIEIDPEKIGGPDRVVIGENPQTANATYVYSEKDNTSWKEVFSYSKPAARNEGSIRLWHAKDPEKRKDHFTKITERAAQLHMALQLYEMQNARN